VWLGSLLLMLWTIGFAPVQRTQEARVLIAAREMIVNSPELGPRAWLVPRANGDVRLQKPPLAYWMAAVSFAIFGVHDWAGRLPFALCGWLTIVLTYHIAQRELQSLRAAIIAAALLVGSLLFHRHARLAETDIVLTLCLTVAIYAIWRERFLISGIAIGLAAITKGLPALFAIVFLIAFALLTRRMNVIWRWIKSGAPILALLIGLPWWIHAWRLPEAQAFARELSVLINEPTHPGWFFSYFGFLAKATLPWTPVLIVALIDIAIRWRRGRGRGREMRDRVAPLLIWCGAILVPLFFIANKQEHYLLPMLPPVAIIAAWFLDRADRAIDRLIAVIGSVALVLSALALPVASGIERGDVFTSDMIVAFALLTLAVIVFVRRDALTFSLACAISMSAGIGFWWPTTHARPHRDVAAEIRTIGDGPYCFYGPNASLVLAYELRTIVPHVRNARELTAAVSRDPNLLVIVQTKNNRAAPQPIGCELLRTIHTEDQQFEIYQSIQD
jgi:4-amino-4-deoxy-L-arabinose transferase-like glycosyltransferase